jgi:hypothetical protein
MTVVLVAVWREGDEGKEGKEGKEGNKYRVLNNFLNTVADELR